MAKDKATRKAPLKVERAPHPDDCDALQVKNDTAAKDKRWTDAVSEAAKYKLMKLASVGDGVVRCSNKSMAKLINTKKEERKIELPDGIFDRVKLAAALKTAGEKNLSEAEIGKIILKVALSEQHSAKRGVWLASNPGDTKIEGSSRSEDMAFIEDDKLMVSPPPITGFPFRPLAGTIINEDGKTDIIKSKDEYIAYLPALCRSHEPFNDSTYLYCVPCEEVAYLADKAQELFDKLTKEMEILPEAELYSITPVLCRYFSDGNKKTQISARWGLRDGGLSLSDWSAVQNDRPLIYDGPAWRVGVKINNSVVSGTIIIAENGSFVATKWCQREINKDGGIELINGEVLPHSLMTWCAGPGVDKFGGALSQQLISRKDTSELTLTSAKIKAMLKILSKTPRSDLEPLLFYWSSLDPTDNTKESFFGSGVYAATQVPKRARLRSADVARMINNPIISFVDENNVIITGTVFVKTLPYECQLRFNTAEGVVTGFSAKQGVGSLSAQLYAGKTPNFFFPEGMGKMISEALFSVGTCEKEGVLSKRWDDEKAGELSSLFDPQFEDITILDISGTTKMKKIEADDGSGQLYVVMGDEPQEEDAL